MPLQILVPQIQDTQQLMMSQKVTDCHENLLQLVAKWHAMSSSHGRPSCY
jgi:hypothetical protein